MSQNIAICAASWLGPEGFGNDRTGLRPWPEALAGRLQQGDLDGLHWSLLSDSDPTRFLRMDLMCRLGFMAVELLGGALDALPDECRSRVGICLESYTGSLDTDIRFALTPRPSIFAYTLPSTVIGEICIRFRLKGPVLSLVSAVPGGGDALGEATDWLQRGDADSVLCFSIEAMNRATAGAVPLPPELCSAGWHAGAVLLARAEHLEPGGAVVAGAVAATAHRLCAMPKRAC
jgi:3-oxoacyl-(acyl-carrier-protein) synthase